MPGSVKTTYTGFSGIYGGGPSLLLSSRRSLEAASANFARAFIIEQGYLNEVERLVSDGEMQPAWYLNAKVGALTRFLSVR